MGDDPDRDAILRRRRQLIALALTGLTTAGCEGKPAPRTTVEQATTTTTEAPMEPIPDGVEAPPAPAVPEEEADVEAPLDPAEIRHAEERKRRLQQPQPCLSTAPTVCLSPMVCLWKSVGDYDPEDV